MARRGRTDVSAYPCRAQTSNTRSQAPDSRYRPGRSNRHVSSDKRSCPRVSSDPVGVVGNYVADEDSDRFPHRIRPDLLKCGSAAWLTEWRVGAIVEMLVRARILALLLMLSVVPSTMELVEAAVHWIEHGDSAHGDGHDSSALGTDEHGCSGTFHLCHCHSANVIASSVIVNLNAYSFLDHEERFEPVSHVGLGAMAPPIRPPIA